jgi:hypothetical protein
MLEHVLILSRGSSVQPEGDATGSQTTENVVHAINVTEAGDHVYVTRSA